MLRHNFPGRREQRQKDAEERNAAWAALTPKQQLRELDKRGCAAKKQRAKIQKAS